MLANNLYCFLSLMYVVVDYQNNKKNFYIQTFGCQMNEYDSERLTDYLTQKGWNRVEHYYDADLVILNTCSVREKATHKIYSEIGRINLEKQKMRKHGRYMIIAIIGCVPEVERNKMFSKAPAIDILLSPQSHLHLLKFVNNILSNLEEKNGNIFPTKTHFMNLELDAKLKFDFLAEERKNFDGETAYITVQEGCNKFCTYCVVPNTRGRELPRQAENIIREAKNIATQGAKEIVLLGQNVSSYKYTDVQGKLWTLVDLIKAIAQIKTIERIKYITSHPIDITQELIDLHKNEKKLVPYLHLPAQSGSNRILKLMNRKYTVEFYLDIIQRFRAAVPSMIFSSDFIVGFPGETDEDFQATLDLIEKVQYQAPCFSFKYSPRPNTIASKMPEQVPETIKKQRLQMLQDKLLAK